MDEVPNEMWRGRLRLVTGDRAQPRRNAPLTEAERDAIEQWIPKHGSILAYTRGRPTRDGRPVWVLTTVGILVTHLTEEGFERLRARAEWIPAEHLRRVDLDVDRELALARLVTISRRFVLFGVDRDSTVRFVGLARAAAAAHAPVRKPRPRAVEALP